MGAPKEKKNCFVPNSPHERNITTCSGVKEVIGGKK